ncbi:MAG: hypothetical protein ACJ75B_14285 [Flavisolibacter sp.]
MKKDSQVLIKLSAAEKESFKRAAELSGIGFSAWARQKLRSAAIKELEDVGEPIAFLTTIKQKKDGR